MLLKFQSHSTFHEYFMYLWRFERNEMKDPWSLGSVLNAAGDWSKELSLLAIWGFELLTLKVSLGISLVDFQEF